MRKTCLTLVGAIVLGGCDAPTRPSEPYRLAPALTSAHESEQRTIKADGAGNAQLPPGFGVSDFEFDVKQNASGKLQGTFRMSRVRNGLTSDFSGELTCLSVDAENRRAWIGGVVTENRSTDPAQQTAIHQPGQDVWFRVADYGEPGSEIADRTTVLGFKGAIPTSAAYCATMPWAAGDVNTFPLVAGDIRVKPKD